MDAFSLLPLLSKPTPNEPSGLTSPFSLPFDFVEAAAGEAAKNRVDWEEVLRSPRVHSRRWFWMGQRGQPVRE